MIETIEIADTTDNKLEVTLRGETAAVIKALCRGLPREALEQLRDAMDRELDARRRARTEAMS